MITLCKMIAVPHSEICRACPLLLETKLSLDSALPLRSLPQLPAVTGMWGSGEEAGAGAQMSYAVTTHAEGKTDYANHTSFPRQ